MAKTKQSSWKRVIFKINAFCGKISKKFDQKDIKNKATKEEVFAILNTIENDTRNFRFLSRLTKLKYFLILSIISLGITFIICFSYLNNFSLGMILFCTDVLISLFLIFLTTYIYKKFIRSTKRKMNLIIHKANQLIFLKRRLYMMACDDFNFIAIYLVPNDVNLGVMINNNSLNEIPNETDPTLKEILKFNKKSSLDMKFTNFNENYITGTKYRL